MNARALAVVLVAVPAFADSVWLTKVGPNRDAVIKKLCETTGDKPSDGADLADSPPVLLKGKASKADADALVAAFAKLKATAVLAPEGSAAPYEAGTFSVRLDDMGSSTIMTIKYVREATNLGLAEAKKLVESAPVVVRANVSKESAEQIVKKLVAHGAKASVVAPAK